MSSSISSLALEGGLDEIATSPGSIARYLRSHDIVKPTGNTHYAVTFTLYKTGTEGPQHGFRLVIVPPQSNPDAVEEALLGLGEVTEETRDAVIFKDGKAVIV